MCALATGDAEQTDRQIIDIKKAYDRIVSFYLFWCLGLESNFILKILFKITNRQINLLRL